MNAIPGWIPIMYRPLRRIPSRNRIRHLSRLPSLHLNPRLSPRLSPHPSLPLSLLRNRSPTRDQTRDLLQSHNLSFEMTQRVCAEHPLLALCVFSV